MTQPISFKKNMQKTKQLSPAQKNGFFLATKRDKKDFKNLFPGKKNHLLLLQVKNPCLNAKKKLLYTF